MGAIRRWLDRLTETDESRLAAETQDWAHSIPGAVRLGEAPLRRNVKIAACSPGARWPKCRFVTAVVHGVTLVGRKSGCCTKALMKELLPDLICPTTAMRHVSCLR